MGVKGIDLGRRVNRHMGARGLMSGLYVCNMELNQCANQDSWEYSCTSLALGRNNYSHPGKFNHK